MKKNCNTKLLFGTFVVCCLLFSLVLCSCVYAQSDGAKSSKADIKTPVYRLEINTATQRVAVFYNVENAEKPIYVFPCSTGKYNNTYKGKYKTSDYYDWRIMLGNVYARYAVRFNGNELFHSVPYLRRSPDSLEYEEFNKLGKPASLGCCRMAVKDMKWIYDYTTQGTPVEVIDDASVYYPLTSKIIKIDVSDENKRGWDPTDPDPESPWNTGDDNKTGKEQ